MRRALGVMALLLLPLLTTGCPPTPAPAESGPEPTATRRPTEPRLPPRRMSSAELRRLPTSNTFASISDAPRDTKPNQAPSGRVVHPQASVPAYAHPGGRAIAVVSRTQLGAATWLPVLEQRPGWLRVALPSRPNGSTGWLAADGRLRIAVSPYLIVVDRGRFSLTLFRDGRRVRRWTVGVGKPGSPTPKGRTFILANLRDRRSTFSPVVLPLGAHSDTHRRYAGGPGTIGIHTWPTDDVFGRASSDGCIRVPRSALTVLSTIVPLGTPVLIK